MKRYLAVAALAAALVTLVAPVQAGAMTSEARSPRKASMLALRARTIG